MGLGLKMEALRIWGEYGVVDTLLGGNPLPIVAREQCPLTIVFSKCTFWYILSHSDEHTIELIF